MNVLLLLTTAIVVSLDSFVVGFGVSLNKKGNLCLPSAVALATLTLCFVTSAIGLIFQKYLQNYVDILGSVLLFTLGIWGLFKKDDGVAIVGNLTLKECFAVGFTVGLDGAVANLTLVASGFGLVAPLTIALAHFLAVWLGQLLAKKVRISNTNKFSSAILIALAVTKLM